MTECNKCGTEILGTDSFAKFGDDILCYRCSKASTIGQPGNEANEKQCGKCGRNLPLYMFPVIVYSTNPGPNCADCERGKPLPDPRLKESEEDLATLAKGFERDGSSLYYSSMTLARMLHRITGMLAELLEGK